jgi:hypothetical protein
LIFVQSTPKLIFKWKTRKAIHKKVGPFKYGMLIVEFGIEKFNKVGILVTEVTEENH